MKKLEFKKGVSPVEIVNTDTYGGQRTLTGTFIFDSWDGETHLFITEPNANSGIRYRIPQHSVLNLEK